MEDCIFCKLANGIYETNTLYEDDLFRVIFDNAPATEGHVLILPKEHYENVYELPEELASKVFVLAKKIATALKEVTGCAGINILQNNGETAGQSVFHFHMHIIPRYENGDSMILWKPGSLNSDVVGEITKKVNDMLA